MKKKKIKKKPWNDNELSDTRKTLFYLGNLLSRDPYNHDLRTRFLKCSKECKKNLLKEKHRNIEKKYLINLSN